MTVNNATTAVAGRSHTLSCSASGANLETATVMYTWRLNVVVMQEPSASNLYKLATDNDPIQVSDAGEVYSCEVTVTGVSYWDVSGSFGGSGSATLSVTSECIIYSLVYINTGATQVHGNSILSLLLQFLLQLYNSPHCYLDHCMLV